jgi:hypothetical protein
VDVLRTYLATFALVLAACGGEPLEPVTPPPPPPPPPPVTDQVLVPVPAEDARVVRCGVDDRPRSVVSMAPATRQISAEERGLLGDRMPEPRGGMAKPMMPPPTQPPRPPRPELTIVVDPPRPTDGGAMSSSLMSSLSASRPRIEACDDLLDVADVGPHDLMVTLTSSGAPSEVRVAESRSPSKFVRCAMEQACQLRGPAGETARVVLPVRIERPRPLPPPPPPVEIATRAVPVRVDLTPIGKGPDSPGLRGLVESVAGACVPSPRDQRVKVRFQVRRASAPAAGRRFEVASTVAEGPPSMDLIGCFVSRLDAERSVRSPVLVEVTWNP